MKNIHLLPTPNPSRLCKDDYGKFYLTETMESYVRYFTNQNIYITNDEEIKEGDCILNLNTNNIVVNWSGHGSMEHWVKIILTTDQDLIKDGVQSIDVDFLNWFVKNPSCEEVEVQCRYNFYVGQYLTHYKIIIPKEEPNYNMKEEILDEMKRPNQYSKPLEGVRTENYHPSDYTNNQYVDDLNTYIDYLELQQKRTYSEGEWLNVLLIFAEWYNSSEIIKPRSLILKDDVQVFISEQFKKK